MNITPVSTTRAIPRKFEYLQLQPGPLAQCLDELKRGWPGYDPANAWYCASERRLYVPGNWVRK